MLNTDSMMSWIKTHFVRKRDIGVARPYTPVITCGGTAFTSIAYTEQVGQYALVGGLVFYAFQIVVNTFTLGAGSGNLYVSLPFPSANNSEANRVRATAVFQGINISGTPIGVGFTSVKGESYGAFLAIQNNSAVTTVTINLLGSGDSMMASGFYFMSEK